MTAARHTRLNVIAISFGILLSLGGVFWGNVHDPSLAVFNIFATILVIFGCLNFPPSESTLLRSGLFIILGFVALSLTQWFYLFSPPFSADYSLIRSGYDKSLWLEDFGVLIWLALCLCLISLIIRSAEANRYFLLSLFYSSLAFVAFTYFIEKMTISSPTYSYTHGFKNQNNAGSYFGVMLLFSLMESFRLLHKFKHKFHMHLAHTLERANSFTVTHTVFVCFSLFLFSVALLSTTSRGAIILFIPAFLCFCSLIVIKQFHSSKNKLWTVLFVGLLLAGVCGSATLLFQHYGTGLSSTFQREGLTSHNRPEMFFSTAKMAFENPLLGVGLGNFPALFPGYRGTLIGSEGVIDKAHNSYIEIFAEMGLIGLSMLLFFATLLLWRLLRTYMGAKEPHYASAGGIAIFSYIALHSLIDFPMQIPAIAGLVLCLLIASGASYKRRKKTTALNR